MADRRKFSFVPKSWAEIYTIISMIGMIIAAITWVVKFYASVETLTVEVSEIKDKMLKVEVKMDEIQRHSEISNKLIEDLSTRRK